MNSSDFRAEARQRLNGKWGKAALIMLVYSVITLIITWISDRLLGISSILFSLAVVIVEVPLSFGLIISYMKLFDGKDVGAFDFLSLGFNNFKKSWGVRLWTVLKMLLPIILIIVTIVLREILVVYIIINHILISYSLLLFLWIVFIIEMVWVVIKYYSYSLANFIAIDSPNITTKEAIKRSKEIMKHKKSKLFLLQLSFIGWLILCAFTFGIGTLWLSPYMLLATVAFYRNVINT